MIRRLRIRLVAVSMLSLFIVLTVIMGTMAVVSWQNLTDNADFTLSILEDNGGVFPKSEDFILRDGFPANRTRSGSSLRNSPMKPAISPFSSMKKG